jgi:hypothetical protein
MTRLDYISSQFFKNWKTSLFGCIIYGLLTFLGFIKTFDWTTLSGYYVAATGFLFASDPNEKENEKPTDAKS